MIDWPAPFGQQNEGGALLKALQAKPIIPFRTDYSVQNALVVRPWVLDTKTRPIKQKATWPGWMLQLPRHHLGIA
jgi:hypothetical protein